MVIKDQGAHSLYLCHLKGSREQKWSKYRSLKERTLRTNKEHWKNKKGAESKENWKGSRGKMKKEQGCKNAMERKVKMWREQWARTPPPCLAEHRCFPGKSQALSAPVASQFLLCHYNDISLKNIIDLMNLTCDVELQLDVDILPLSRHTLPKSVHLSVHQLEQDYSTLHMVQGPFTTYNTTYQPYKPLPNNPYHIALCQIIILSCK